MLFHHSITHQVHIVTLHDYTITLEQDDNVTRHQKTHDSPRWNVD